MGRYKQNVVNTDKSINCVLGLLDECGSRFLPTIARNLTKLREVREENLAKFKEAKDKAKDRVRSVSESVGKL